MINIICKRNSNANIKEITSMEYSELLKEECYFCIIVDNLVFFEDPLFPIREFLKYYFDWDKKNNFNYITIESSDNPLLSFIKTSEGWSIDSVWKKFECDRKFTLSELCNAINKATY